jgi:hypothetical protein
MKHITNEKGQWIGHVDERDGMTTFTDAKGKVVSRVIEDRTFDAKGKFAGSGNQGMRFIKNSN